jgi:hypothetical protein
MVLMVLQRVVSLIATKGHLVADWSGTDFVDGVHISDHGDYGSVSVSIAAVARVSH